MSRFVLVRRNYAQTVPSPDRTTPMKTTSFCGPCLCALDSDCRLD